jgi:hypothetical protein
MSINAPNLGNVIKVEGVCYYRTEELTNDPPTVITADSFENCAECDDTIGKNQKWHNCENPLDIYIFDPNTVFLNVNQSFKGVNGNCYVFVEYTLEDETHVYSDVTIDLGGIDNIDPLAPCDLCLEKNIKFKEYKNCEPDLILTFANWAALGKPTIISYLGNCFELLEGTVDPPNIGGAAVAHATVCDCARAIQNYNVKWQACAGKQGAGPAYIVKSWNYNPGPVLFQNGGCYQRPAANNTEQAWCDAATCEQTTFILKGPDTHPDCATCEPDPPSSSDGGGGGGGGGGGSGSSSGESTEGPPGGSDGGSSISESVTPEEELVNTLYLDGVDQYLDVGNPTPLQITDNITVSCWVYLDTLSSMYAISKHLPSSDQRGWYLAHVAGAFVFRVFSDGLGTADAEAVSSITPTINTWYHLVGTYDGADVKLYVDAIEEDSVPYTSDIHNTTANVLVGAMDVGTGLWEGSMTEVMIFNSALSPSNVTTLYNSTVAKQPWRYNTSFRNNYVLALPLNSGIAVGREFEDYSGYEHNPTLINVPTITGSFINVESTLKFGTFLFDGVDNYVTVPSTVLLDIRDGNRTHVMWIKTVSSATMQLINKMSSGAGVDNYSIYMALGKIYARVSQDADTEIKEYSTDDTFNDNVWHCIAVDWNAFNVFKIYIDGIEVPVTQTETGTITAPIISTADLCIGYNPVTMDDYFVGSMCFVSMFTRRLTSLEIKTLYNQNLPKDIFVMSPAILSGAVMILEMTANDDTLLDISLNASDGTSFGSISTTGSEIDVDDLFISSPNALALHIEGNSGFTDISPNGHVVTTVGGPDQIPAVYNGNDTLRCYGLNEYFQANGAAPVFDGNTWEAILVIRNSSTLPFTPAMNWLEYTNNNSYSYISTRDTDLSNGSVASIRSAAFIPQVINDTSDVGDNLHIFNVKLNGNLLSFRINSETVQYTDIADHAVDHDTLTFGALVRDDDPIGVNFGQYDYAEILLFNRVLTNSERDQYLSDLIIKYF